MSSAVLIAGVVFGSIGLGYFIYGKKVSNMVIRYTGVALMIFPYFVQNTIVLIVIGVGLLFLPKFIKI